MKIRSAAAAMVAGMAVLCWSGSALGAPGVHGGGGGGHGGGSRAGGGGHVGGGGAVHGGYAGGGNRGAYGGGYGGRGGYGGYRGGYGYRGYGGWGLGGLGLGLYFATLPFYYSTLWAEGVPYYYADDNYYQWDSTVGQYQTVSPPAEVQQQAAMQSPDLIAYPKNGQTAGQQATDRNECRTWAAGQSGFDLTPANQSASEGSAKHADYMRAQAACLDGRGYSVR